MINLAEKKSSDSIGLEKTEAKGTYVVQKEEIKLEKPPSKREFISKTTEINIIPPKNKEIESEIFDEYFNRPLTGI